MDSYNFFIFIATYQYSIKFFNLYKTYIAVFFTIILWGYISQSHPSSDFQRYFDQIVSAWVEIYLQFLRVNQ